MGSDPINFLLPLLALDGFPLLDIAASVALLGLLVAIGQPRRRRSVFTAPLE